MQSYRNAVLALPGLIGYWRMGETQLVSSTAVAKDETGRYNGDYFFDPIIGSRGLLAGDPIKGMTGTGLNASPASMRTAVLPALSTWSVTIFEQGPTAPRDFTAIWGMPGSDFVTGRFLDDSIQYYDGTVWTTTGTSMAPNELAHHGWTFDGTTVTFVKNGIVAYSAARGRAIASQVWEVGAFLTAGVGGTLDTLSDFAVWGRVLAPNDIAKLSKIGRGF